MSQVQRGQAPDPLFSKHAQTWDAGECEAFGWLTGTCHPFISPLSLCSHTQLQCQQTQFFLIQNYTITIYLYRSFFSIFILSPEKTLNKHYLFNISITKYITWRFTVCYLWFCLLFIFQVEIIELVNILNTQYWVHTVLGTEVEQRKDPVSLFEVFHINLFHKIISA